MSCVEPLHPDPVRPRRPLQVAVVTDTYPPEVNGVARTLERLVGGLAERGHGVQVVRPAQGRYREAATPEETVLVSAVPLPFYPGLHLGLPAGRRIVEAWRRRRPDVLYLATEGPLGWSALRQARRLELPVVSGFHTNFHQYSRHYGAAALNGSVYRYLRRLHNRTACTLVPTPALARELSRSGFQRVKVMGRGVDARLFDPARRDSALRRSWGLEPGDRAVLYVGRLAPEKNLPLAIDAFYAMQDQDPRLRFVVVGDGPLAAELRRRHPGFIFTGFLEGERLARHYASGDIFLFPSETETFGNVVLEAMASALAVVAYDCAAAHDLIRHRRNGLLAPGGDREAFIRLAVELARDWTVGEALRGEARHRARGQAWGGILDCFEQTLLGAAQGGE